MMGQFQLDDVDGKSVFWENVVVRKKDNQLLKFNCINTSKKIITLFVLSSKIFMEGMETRDVGLY